MDHAYNTETTAEIVVRDLAEYILGSTVLVTGVSPGGLGAFFVEQIALSPSKPKLIILAGRSRDKVQTVANLAEKFGAPTKILQLDLSSLSHVRRSAAEVIGWEDVPKIDVLINNAGIMAVPYEKTADGFEKQLATNHLGPFLFTNLILSKVLASANPRVVNVASDGHRLSPFRFADFGFHEGDNYDRWLSYGQSKTANMLFTVALAQKLGKRGLIAVSLHPGVIGTNLGNHINWEKEFGDLVKVDRFLGNFEGWKEGFDFKSPTRGVMTHVYAAFAPKLAEHNGAYLLDGHIADPKDPGETVKSWATSEVEAERLWDLSEQLVGQQFLF